MVSPALIRRLNALYDKAEEVYKKEDVERRIVRLSRLYHEGRGENISDSENRIHVNKVYPRVRTAMAAHFAKRPEIIVRGRRPEDTTAAQVAEVLLNYLTRVLKLSRELREWLFWSRLGMYGIMKLGMTKWRGFELPTFRTHDPRSVRVDVSPDRFRPEEGQWQAFRYRVSLAQARASGLYESAALNALADTIASRTGEAFSEETTSLWVWEHYLREGKKIMLVVSANGFDDTGFAADERHWIREEEFTDVVDLPGRFLVFVPSPHQWYPVSPIELWLEQLKEINAFRTQKILHAERSNRKRFYDVSAFTEEELSKLARPDPNIYIGVNPTRSASIKDAVAEEPQTPVSQDVYSGEIEADNTITEIDGVGSAQLGVELPKRGSTSATRDAIVENNLRLRMSDNQEIWEEALEDAYQGLLNLAQEHMKGALFLKVTGGQMIRMSRDDIKGDMDVSLSFGSTLPKDREREWQQASELYDKLAGNPLVDQRRLTRYLLQQRGDIKDGDQWIVTTPPPVPGAIPGNGSPGQIPPEFGAGQAQANMAAQQATQGGATPLSIAAGLRGLV